MINPNDRTLPFLPGKILFGRSHIKSVALERLDAINVYCKVIKKKKKENKNKIFLSPICSYIYSVYICISQETGCFES